MTEFQILLTVMITGFGFNGALLMVMWNHFNGRLDKLDERINKQEMDMVEVKTILRMIEGGLSSHGHCLFSQTKPEQKAQ